MADNTRQFLVVFVFALLLWLGLTASLRTDELIAGVLIALAAALLSLNHSPIFAGLRLTPAAPLAFLRYLLAFSVALVRANLDMARRVLAPSLPIRPGLVRIKTTLQSDIGRLALANSITLTPGTLSIDLQADELLVHWIDCPPDTDMAAATHTIAADFERHLKGFLR